MIVVSDTTPINYLILIGEIEILPALYGNVILPQAVLLELQNEVTPTPVRAWTDALPQWIEVRKAAAPYMRFGLDAGESEALAIMEEIEANLLLVDDSKARLVAEHKGIEITGTLGVLARAAELGLLSLADAITKLRSTTFQASEALLQWFLEQHAKEDK